MTVKKLIFILILFSWGMSSSFSVTPEKVKSIMEKISSKKTKSTSNGKVYLSNVYDKNSIDELFNQNRDLILDNKLKQKFSITSIFFNPMQGKISISGTDSTDSFGASVTPDCYRVYYEKSSDLAPITRQNFTANRCETSLTNLSISTSLFEGSYKIWVVPIFSGGAEGQFSNSVIVDYTFPLSLQAAFGKFGVNATGDGELEYPMAVTKDNTGKIWTVTRGSPQYLVSFDESDFNGTLTYYSNSDLGGICGIAYDSTNDLLWLANYNYGRVSSATPANPTGTITHYGIGLFGTYCDIKNVGTDFYVPQSSYKRVSKFSSPTFTSFVNYLDTQNETYSGIGYNSTDNKLWVIATSTKTIAKFSPSDPNGTYEVVATGSSSLLSTAVAGITFDPYGYGYINDKNNNKILVFNSQDFLGTATSAFGNFTKSSSGSALSTPDSFSYYDVSGDALYVPDRYGGRILKFSINRTNRTFYP